MITYQFSKREKALIAVFVILLLAIAWYMLVYQTTTNEMNRLDGEIAEAETTATLDTARVSQLNQMKHDIELRKAEGATPTPVPDYDNLQPLMMELNNIMAMTESYSMSFDKLEDPTDGYVYRGASLSFECASYDAAESVIDALAKGRYPCLIDSASIVNSTARSSRSDSGASASIHVIFFEKA